MDYLDTELNQQQKPLDIGFAPWMVAGVQTQWENMLPHVIRRTDLRAHVAEIRPYLAAGIIESLPILPGVLKGNMRSMLCAGPLLRTRGLDAIWTGEPRAFLPYLIQPTRQTPVIISTDSTSVQQAAFGGFYAKASHGSARASLRDAIDTLCLRRAAVIVPWSNWAARGLIEDHGIDPRAIHVIPPGVDLDRWPVQRRRRNSERPLQLLFVGGDFARKGGELLLDVFAQHLSDRCELHIVTRSDVETQPGIHVYNDFQPNDQRLRQLYAHCDVFVLPTLADCYSLVSLEAMATGLPVITTAVGGIPEIVSEGKSGFLIAPNDGASLLQRIIMLLNTPGMRAEMGDEGRRIVESHFNAEQTTARLLNLIVDLCRGSRASGEFAR